MKNKYTYSVNGNTVYCIKHYAGRPVRGIAKCDPFDSFNLDDGKDLSRARCDVRIAEKRLKMKNKKVERAIEELQIAIKNAENAGRYQEEAVFALEEARKALAEIEAKLS